MNPYDFYITPEEYEQAALNGVDAFNLERRIRLLGWKKSCAIQTPIGRITNRQKWAEIAKKNGIGYQTFMTRVNVHGWSQERAASEPLQDRKKAAAIATEKIRRFPAKYLKLAEQNGIPYHTFRMRVIKSGWSMKDASTKPIMTNAQAGKIGAKALREREGDWAATIFKTKEARLTNENHDTTINSIREIDTGRKGHR